ncbi:putative 5-dehydro-4-deoxyglucarate dehydratase [Brevibacillus reuszeri]|uniref:5-dehydro-4-deoxyglucarate dehydratase n=1 Tax=Brevibacillus reuszeri TaxID=54915 RepID=UPI001B2F7FD6|nr:5-dehydro-4-deoxyglucarate dehydratase [Brevibacillus reuszeri]GIO10227.1 putative 5-dehydro-4-deoxyglucarate dehydratase [Brevibacillus reuszeri]
MNQQRTSPTGILGFPVAPMDKDRKLDLKGLESNIRFLMDEGLSSIFVACGAGEFHALSNDEYREMVEVAVATTKGKVPLYTGVGGNISHALEQTKISEEMGAEGYLILPPYLIDPSSEGLYDYLRTVITSTSLNAIVYHRDNCQLNLEVLEHLIELPQLVGFKDGIGDIELNNELTLTIGERLEWINGMPLAEVTMASYVNLGFRSYSSAISNYIPHISMLFYDALLNQKNELLHDVYQEVILPIHRIRRQKKGYAVALIKAGMEIVGLPVGTSVRPPVTSVDPEHYRQLERIINVAFEKFPKQK